MRWFLALSLPLYIIDLISKLWIVRNFQDPQGPYDPEAISRIVVIEGFFEITRVHNTGVAFGMGDAITWSNLLFGTISVFAFCLIVVLWRKNFFFSKCGKLSAALLLSGILGNTTDRIVYGYVVDFLDFDLGFMRWPSFNVADACISIAAVLLLVTAFQKDPNENPTATASAK